MLIDLFRAELARPRNFDDFTSHLKQSPKILHRVLAVRGLETAAALHVLSSLLRFTRIQRIHRDMALVLSDVDLAGFGVFDSTGDDIVFHQARLCILLVCTLL